MTLIEPPLIVAALIFIGVFSLAVMVGGWIEASVNRFNANLLGERETSQADSRVIRALGRTFRGLAIPFRQRAEWLEQQLVYAGRPYGGITGQDYLAATMVLSVLVGIGVGVFFALAGAVTGAEAADLVNRVLLWALILSPLVAIYLVLDVKTKATEISEEIEREFPFFLDLAVLVVQAGGTPYKALGKYVEASPGTALSKEIAITAKDVDATNFEDAMNRLIDRVQPTSVKTILKNLVQGEKSSGEAEEFYTAQAEELRYLREEMANRTAERLRTNIVFPVFLMLSGIIIAALAPTIVSITSQGFF